MKSMLGFKKYRKEFHNTFNIRLSVFINKQLLLVGIHSFDIIEFDKYLHSLGYNEDNDGSISDYLESKYGIKTRELIENIMEEY